MSSYRLLMLGRPAFEGQGLRTACPATKPSALLWYLAAQPDREFSRAHLSTLLWEGLPENKGRQSLSSTLIRLRQSLPFWPLRVQGEMIGWNPGAGVTVDTDLYLLAVANEDWTAAASLWRGPFLDGVAMDENELFTEWLVVDRQAWVNRITHAFSMLIRQAEAEGNVEAVIHRTQKAIAVNPLQEPFHQSLITAFYKAGDRASALAQYRECERLLQEELGVAPDPSTSRLRDAILTGQSVPSAGPSASRVNEELITEPTGEESRLPLSGRDPELDRLRAWLGRVARNAQSALLITGDQGLGKTRLITEGLRHAYLSERQPPARSATVLIGRCHEESASFPLEPLRSLQPAHTRPSRASELQPYQRLVAGLPVALSASQPPGGYPEWELFHRICESLQSLSGPLLLVLEDIHWADRQTMRLLAYLMHHRFPAGMGLLLSLRPGQAPDGAERLVRGLEHDALLDRVALSPLNSRETESLVAAWRGHPAPVLSAEIYQEALGNPLFTVELLRYLESRNWDTTHADAGLPLPPSLVSLLNERVAGLPPSAADLVRAVSVFSEPMPISLLQHLTQLAEEALLDALDQSMATGVLAEDGDGARVAFSHPMLRRAVCQSLSGSRRRMLNRRTFEFLERANQYSPT